MVHWDWRSELHHYKESADCLLPRWGAAVLRPYRAEKKLVAEDQAAGDVLGDYIGVGHDDYADDGG